MFGGEVEKIQSRRGPGRRPPGGIPGWLRYAILSVSVLVLAVCISGGIFALLFSRGDPVVSQRIVQLISDAVGSDSTRIESDRVHGSVFGGAILENPRLVVLTPDGPVVWLHATRLRAEYDTYQLLFSRRRSLRITIDSPVVPLVHDKHGNLIVPRFHGSKRNPLDKSATRIEVSFQNGTLSLDRGDVRFGNIAGNALATLEPDKTTLRVTRISGKSLMPDRPANIKAEGLATVSGGHMRFDPLYVVLDHSRIRSAIDWDLEHARVVSSRTGVSPLEVAEVMRLLDLSPPAQGILYGEVQFAGDPSSGNAVARLSGTLQGEQVDTLFVRATLVPGAIHVDDGRMRVRETEVQGRAVFETHRGMLTAEARLKNVNPAQIPWWRVPANTPRGSLAGTARIRAVRAKPYPVADVSMDLERGNLGRLLIERGFVHTRLGQRGDLSVDTAWVDTPGARLVASGTVSPDTLIAFSYEAQVRDLGAMSGLLKPVSLKSGKGRIQGTLRGRSSAPDFQLQGTLTSGAFTNGMSFDSLRISSRGKVTSPPAATADVTMTGLRAGERPLGDVVSTLTITDRIAVDRYRETLGDTTLTLHGDVRFRGETATATLDSLTFSVGERAWRNVQPVQASLDGHRPSRFSGRSARDRGRRPAPGRTALGSGRPGEFPRDAPAPWRGGGRFPSSCRRLRPGLPLPLQRPVGPRIGLGHAGRDRSPANDTPRVDARSRPEGTLLGVTGRSQSSARHEILRPECPSPDRYQPELPSRPGHRRDPCQRHGRSARPGHARDRVLLLLSRCRVGLRGAGGALRLAEAHAGEARLRARRRDHARRGNAADRSVALRPAPHPARLAGGDEAPDGGCGLRRGRPLRSRGRGERGEAQRHRGSHRHTGAAGGDRLPSPQGRHSESRGAGRGAGGARGERVLRRAPDQRDADRRSRRKAGPPDRERMVAIGGQETVRRLRISPPRGGVHGHRPGNLQFPLQRRLQGPGRGPSEYRRDLSDHERHARGAPTRRAHDGPEPAARGLRDARSVPLRNRGRRASKPLVPEPGYRGGAPERSAHAAERRLPGPHPGIAGGAGEVLHVLERIPDPRRHDQLHQPGSHRSGHPDRGSDHGPRSPEPPHERGHQNR